MSARIPTDEQLTQIVRFVARTGLEVERGLRPPEQLLKLMDPPTANHWRQQQKLGRFTGGAVREVDVGRPRFSWLTDTSVVATVVTRTQGERWGALTLRLQASSSGRWQVADLQRLLAAAHYRSGPEQPTLEVSIEERLQLATEDRRLAGSALEATRRRLADLDRDDPGYRASRSLVGWWRDRVADLDRELTDLRARHKARASLDPPLRR